MLGFAPLSEIPLSESIKDTSAFTAFAAGKANVNANAVAQFFMSAGINCVSTVNANANFIAFVNMSAIGNAQVDIELLKTAMASANVTSVAIIDLDAYRLQFASASVNADATTNFDAIKITLIGGSVLAEAQVTFTPVAVFSAFADFEVIATTTNIINKITFTSASVNADGTTDIDIELIGENWTIVPEGTNVWLRRG